MTRSDSGYDWVKKSARELTRELAVSELVYSTYREEIEKVIVDGRVVVERGRLTEVEEGALLAPRG